MKPQINKKANNLNNKEHTVIKQKASEANYKSYVTKEPNFFNKTFMTISKFTSYSVAFYIVFTTILYFIIHFNLGQIIKSKSFLLEYDAILYQNLFINTIFSIFILINHYGIKYQKISAYVFLSFSSTALYFSYISFLGSKDFFIFEYLQLLKVSLLGLGSSLSLYLVYNFFANLNHLRNFLSDNFTFKEIYHEIALRTDMIKFSHNNFIMKYKLHKVFPGLLYKKDSFYYLTVSEGDRDRFPCQKKLDDSDSVQINIDDEKQKLISQGSSKNAYLSTMGEY